MQDWELGCLFFQQYSAWGVRVTAVVMSGYLYTLIEKKIAPVVTSRFTTWKTKIEKSQTGR